jgi:cobalt-zinc-cadmium efflux system protein
MSHSHNHSHSPEVTGKNLSVSIFLNIIITLAQIVGGFISGSLSLISDALHNFSDVLSLILSLAAHKISKRKPSFKNTFGYKRAEIIAAFINSATLVIVAFYLIYEAIIRFAEPVEIGYGLVIWLSVLGILFNGFSAMLLKNDAVHNSNMKSAYLHLLTDMMASVAVLVGGILMYYFQWFWVDSLITFAIAVYLIAMGYGLLKSSTKTLMLFTPENIDIEQIIAKVHNITGNNKLHHIHIWNLNDNQLHFEAHLDCCEDITITRFAAIANDIKEILHHDFHITHCTIQPEFGNSCRKDFIAED